MLRRAGQRAQSLHHDQECSAEEGVVLLRTKRQGKPQLPAPRCPSSSQIHTSLLSTFLSGGKKKPPTKQQSDCLQVFWLHVK